MKVKRGCDLGLVNRAKYYYSECRGCHKMRWTATPDRLCRSCADKAKLAKCRAGECKKVGDVIKYHDYCPSCGKELWRHKEYLGKMCSHCTAVQNGKAHRGERNGQWKGGRQINRYGYVEIVIYDNDPYFPMVRKNKNMVLEHRYVVAKFLGRCLESWEIVHHKNGVKTDNRIENLELLPRQADHVCIQQLTKRIATLEKDLWLLRQQYDLLQHGNLVLSGGVKLPKCVETIDSISYN